MMSRLTSSQYVRWLAVHRWVTPLLEAVQSWPMAGTAEWSQLPDDDPRKWAAVLDAGQHWALRIENNQTARAEASMAVSGAADWAAIGRANHRRADAIRSGAYIERASAQPQTARAGARTGRAS